MVVIIYLKKHLVDVAHSYICETADCSPRAHTGERIHAVCFDAGLATVFSGIDFQYLTPGGFFGAPPAFFCADCAGVEALKALGKQAEEAWNGHTTEENCSNTAD